MQEQEGQENKNISYSIFFNYYKEFYVCFFIYYYQKVLFDREFIMYGQGYFFEGFCGFGFFIKFVYVIIIFSERVSYFISVFFSGRTQRVMNRFSVVFFFFD